MLENFEKITIAILNRDGISRLRKTIPSIVHQNYHGIEILVFDNASTDESLEYLSDFSQIKVIKSSQNIGYGSAKNILVKNSTGKYILLLDNDIVIDSPDSVGQLLSSFLSVQNIAFLSPIVRDVGCDFAKIGLSYNKRQKFFPLEKIRDNGLIKCSAYRGNTVFFERNTFLKLGLFDEIYPFNIDDYDISARSYVYGYQIFTDTSVVVTHIGIETRNNITPITWKYRYYFSGFARGMIKNYSLTNVIIYFLPSFLWITYKSLRSSLEYSSIKPFLSHVYSIYNFVIHLKNTINFRKVIQKNRVQKDIYLKI